MAGYDLESYTISEDYHSEDELWSAINTVFLSKSRNSTSYKFCFLKAILDNIFNVDAQLVLPFYTIFERFTEIYWNLIIKFGLKQMPGVKLTVAEKLIQSCAAKYALCPETSFDALRNEIKLELCTRVTKECSRFVVGALCEDTKKIFYGFSKEQQFIKFNPDAYSFLCKFGYVLTKLNYFEWVKYLEKVNATETAFALASKLDASTKRENLSFYSDFLLDKLGQHRCFYCGAPLEEHCEVDHFIPWSFVKDDKVWNFVQACRTCNNGKRDYLAQHIYVDALVTRNQELLAKPRLLEIVDKEFTGYTDHKLNEMYNSAAFNGFDTDWLPKNRFGEQDE